MIKLKSLIKEYVSNPIIQLGDYLKMSDEQKGTQLAFDFSNDLYSFIHAHYPNLNIPDMDNLQGYDLVEYVHGRHPEVLKAYGNSLLQKLDAGRTNEFFMRTGYPSWHFLEFRSYVKNQWLIHFSNNAVDIWREQTFKYGMDDYETLGLTTYHGKESKRGGYNFAYDISDYAKYGRSNFRSGEWKYGKEAVIFRASGVKTWHYGDNEPQVIFWGKTAKDIVLISQADPGPWAVINSKTGNSIFIGEISDVVKWVVSHFDQYKNVLLP